MEELTAVLEKYGPWGLILLALVYILLKGQFTFTYPRIDNNDHKK